MNIYFLLTTVNTTLILFLLYCVSFSPGHGAILHKTTNIRNQLARDAEAIPTSSHDDAHGKSFRGNNVWNSPGTDTWRRTGIRFLTKVKWDNLEDGSGNGINLPASDFHIIELEPEGADDDDGQRPHRHHHHQHPKTIRIHLMRKSSVVHPELRVVVKDGVKEETWIPSSNSTGDCHYVGSVTSTPAGSREESIGGVAVFSACPPANGFTGLIILEDGRQWYMEPVADSSAAHHSRSKRDASSRYESLEHVLLPHSALAGHLAAHISDVLRVPLPKLEEAARLAAIDAEARRSMRQITSGIGSSWDDDSSLETLQGESSILTPFFYGGASLPFIGRGRGDHSRVNHARKLSGSRKSSGSSSSSSAQTTLLTPLDSSSRSTTTAGSTSTFASAPIENPSPLPRKQPHVVEIAVFTDEELYAKMKSKLTLDTTAQLKEYATAMVNMMDVMYQHASLGVDLRFRLVYVEVMKKRPPAMKTNGGRAKAYLSSFCDYAGEKNVNSGQWDHALLLTGIDLHEEGVKTTAGLAWAGTMCFRYYSCSISEGLNFASAYITTHEIGHSLGMEHDGVGISEACDSTKFIMSPTTGPGKVTWSSCSSTNLNDFIKYGTSELRGKTKSHNMISKPTCLNELVSSRNKKSFNSETVEPEESDSKLPGEKYDANFQCSLGMGTFFKPHFERHKPPFDNICWILYCGNGTHAISTHPALEGTPCDRKKYCRAGQCVKRPG